MNKELANKSSYKSVIDIIDHLSKFMALYPIEENNDINATNSITEFSVCRKIRKSYRPIMVFDIIII